MSTIRLCRLLKLPTRLSTASSGSYFCWRRSECLGTAWSLFRPVYVTPGLPWGGTALAAAVVTLVNDLLLVMIIMEVLRTVLSYLQERATSLQPFLFIAAISATRRIPAIGAQMSVTGDTLSPDKFRQVMIDLGANAGAILAIAVALYLLAGRSSDGRELP
jgi:uncharacterized membrane protein (DUF373 family)